MFLLPFHTSRSGPQREILLVLKATGAIQDTSEKTHSATMRPFVSEVGEPKHLGNQTRIVMSVDQESGLRGCRNAKHDFSVMDSTRIRICMYCAKYLGLAAVPPPPQIQC